MMNINVTFEEKNMEIHPQFNEFVKPDTDVGGTVFYPNVSDDGIISWTNNGDLPNPEPVNIKGADGKDGVDGKDGYTPQKGIDYFDGEPGKDAPQESVLYTAQTLTEEQQAQVRKNIGATTADEVKDVYNITSIDTIYKSVEELPLDVGNGTHYVVASSTERAIYKFDATTGEWSKRINLTSNSLYVVLTGNKVGLYRCTMSSPYLLRVEPTILYTMEQGLTAEQKAQARANIGAVTVDEVIAALPVYNGEVV